MVKSCKYCYNPVYGFNDKLEPVCERRHKTGSCVEEPSRNKPCPCGSKKNYKNCCAKKMESTSKPRTSGK